MDAMSHENRTEMLVNLQEVREKVDINHENVTKLFVRGSDAFVEDVKSDPEQVIRFIGGMHDAIQELFETLISVSEAALRLADANDELKTRLEK